MQIQLEGRVDHMVFCNEENGYTVVRIELLQGDAPHARIGQPVVVVGTMFQLQRGESLRFIGYWEEDFRYGWQFRADKVIPVDPKTCEEIIDYLSSKSFKGIGKARARAIVEHFGHEAIQILDGAPERLCEAPGIPENVATDLSQNWRRIRMKRAMMTYVQGLGINADIAQRIFDKYGAETEETLERNPFLLDEEFVHAIGFKLVDQLARNRGGDPLDKYRLWTGLEHSLQRLSREGHTCAPPDVLIDNAAKLLQVEAAHLQPTIRLRLLTGNLIKDDIVGATASQRAPVIYLPEYHQAESSVARRMRALAGSEGRIGAFFSRNDLDSFIRGISYENVIGLAHEQEGAVRGALENKLSVITGGPGTGKTSALRMLISVLIETNHSFALSAPTGRAAKRLSEATKEEASTIHRLLGFMPETLEFKHGIKTPLPYDMVVVDEASMLDIELFQSLLHALPLKAHLLLVGDPFQLPSVGAGNVLRDIIRSGAARVTELKRIHRQDEGSQIAAVAQDIRNGRSPNLKNDQAQDFWFFPISRPQAVADQVVALATEKLPRKFGFDPLRELQALAPMYKGPAGITNLNDRLRVALALTDGKEFVKVRGRAFRVGDKVMQTRNNYEKGVYNGDIGFVASINHDDNMLEVLIDDSLARYEFGEAHELDHAYCISIHKSQGSEYPAVIVPIMRQQGRMLQRNLLYTAITRAKQLVVLVGSRQAVWTAIANDKTDERCTGLRTRLLEEFADLPRLQPT